MVYDNIDEAILEVKKRPKPLSAFLFSKDQKAIDHFLYSLSFGGGAINQVNIHLFVETMPFGGVESSGIGNYYGKYGFDSLTHALFNDTNLNPHLPLRTELSRADTFLFALFFVGLIRSPSIGSPRVETAINHASNPNSSPLAGLISPNT
jgi:hypothetical protein